ncbi:sedoheptulose-1,7-bisphosphatase [Xylaria intraflava]|nr:sedoheptulose-1,7-bisphosphatase [Xylaria intraflava]
MTPTPLTPHLQTATGGSHPSLEAVLHALLRSIGRTAEALRGAHSVTQAGTDNVFGDAQLNVDVQAERAFRDEIASCPAIVAASSEEDPEERSKAGGDGDGSNSDGNDDDDDDVYAVAFDPLDGSSIIAPNWSVGSIVGVWAGRTALRRDPRAQVAAVLGVYGPRTTAIVAVRVPGREAHAVCLEVAVDELGGRDIVRAGLALRAEGAVARYFAPANLRAAAEDARYMALVTHFVSARYTLRYSGGLVPDVVHALVKGHGVYVSPVTARSKAKLRRAFELLPVALVVECAGGAAIDPVDGRRVLETALGDLGETGGLVCGCVEEVGFVRGALLGE